MELPAPVQRTLATWLDEFDTIAPGTIEGLYLVGSVALGDWTPHSDIDVVAVVADPSDPDLFTALAEAHRSASERIEIDVDGPFLAWGDLVVAPVGVARPWTLAGEFHVDGECFEINPVVWYTRATYGLAVRGDPPAVLGIPLDEADRRSWVAENVLSYWRPIGEQLRAQLAAAPSATGDDGAILEWVALGVARMLYTYETGDVRSKSDAGRWAAARLPEFADCLDAAVRVRHTRGEAQRSELEGVVGLVERVAAMMAP